MFVFVRARAHTRPSRDRVRKRGSHRAREGSRAPVVNGTKTASTGAAAAAVIFVISSAENIIGGNSNNNNNKTVKYKNSYQLAR